jgi:hypothetical protein
MLPALTIQHDPVRIGDLFRAPDAMRLMSCARVSTLIRAYV